MCGLFDGLGGSWSGVILLISDQQHEGGGSQGTMVNTAMPLPRSTLGRGLRDG